MSEIRVLSVVGARPQFVKLAPVERALARQATAESLQLRSIIVHTGQHYDDNMSRVFFEELAIPSPSANLAVGSGRHGEQTGRMLDLLETVMLEHRPHAVVVYGDTNSTIAGTLAATKLHIPVAHVEAGLRSFDRRMPEEVNRIATDHLSDVLLAPTESAVQNLAREGLQERTVHCGDVMYDAVLFNAALAGRREPIARSLGFEPGEYGLVTVHRAHNTEPARLKKLLEFLNVSADRQLPMIFPIHPRTAHVIREQLGDWKPSARLKLIDPLGYLDMLSAVQNARCVLTDSGGLQKEAAFLGCPCLTLRDETEWVETVAIGANVLVGAEGQRLSAELNRICANRRDAEARARMATAVNELYGGGRASEVVAERVLALARRSDSAPSGSA